MVLALDRSTAAAGALGLIPGGLMSPSLVLEAGTPAASRSPSASLALSSPPLWAKMVIAGALPAPPASSPRLRSAPAGRTPSPGRSAAPPLPVPSEAAAASDIPPEPPARSPPSAGAVGGGAAARLAPKEAAQAAKEPLVRTLGGTHVAAASPAGSASLNSCCTRRRASPALRTSLCSSPTLSLSAPRSSRRRAQGREH